VTVTMHTVLAAAGHQAATQHAALSKGGTVTISIGVLGAVIGFLSWWNGGTSTIGGASWLVAGMGGGGFVASAKRLLDLSTQGLDALMSAKGSAVTLTVGVSVIALVFGIISLMSWSTTWTGAISWGLAGLSGGGILGAIVMALFTYGVTFAIAIISRLAAS
jgi:hypothetical protein